MGGEARTGVRELGLKFEMGSFGNAPSRARSLARLCGLVNFPESLNTGNGDNTYIDLGV